MGMLTIRIDDELEAGLAELAKDEHKTRAKLPARCCAGILPLPGCVNYANRQSPLQKLPAITPMMMCSATFREGLSQYQCTGQRPDYARALLGAVERSCGSRQPDSC